MNNISPINSPNNHKKSGNSAPPSIIVPLDLPQPLGKSKNEFEPFGPELISEASSFSAEVTPAKIEPDFEASSTSGDPDNPTITSKELQDAKDFSKNKTNNYIRSLEKENSLLKELLNGLLRGDTTTEEVASIIFNKTKAADTPDAINSESFESENTTDDSTKNSYIINLLENFQRKDEESRQFMKKSLALLEKLILSLVATIKSKDDFLEVNDDSKRAAENLINNISDIFGKIKKTPQNSSEKPSSQKFKPKKKPELGPDGKPIKGKPGGKKGHPGRSRSPISEKDADKVIHVLLNGQTKVISSKIEETSENSEPGEKSETSPHIPEMEVVSPSEDTCQHESTTTLETSPLQMSEDCHCPHSIAFWSLTIKQPNELNK